MDAYISEIRPLAFTYAPENWAACDGTVLSANQYQVLFSLLGGRFGGDGRTSFGLPNLNGTMVNGSGQGNGLTIRTFAQGYGAPTAPAPPLPAHSHSLYAQSPAVAVFKTSGQASPTTGAMFSRATAGASLNVTLFTYSNAAADQTLNSNTVAVTGTATPTPIPTQQPFLSILYAICVNYGDYPINPN
ncbi:phage tail protein [Ferrovibrio sp.]|uniref:phage tail protein n=1 Tax=Ferrovibrio sp. TaxID=1917215 RepID=UPI003D2C7CAE